MDINRHIYNLRQRAVSPRGLTLVELLIVIAIIAIMAAVAVPTFARYGFLFGNRLRNTSREVFTLLRSAKTYAINHRVDAGVAYLIQTDPDLTTDSLSGAANPIIDGMALVRRLTEEEATLWGFRDRIDDPCFRNGDPCFVQVGTSDGDFKRFDEQTAVLTDVFEINSQTQQSARMLEPIRIFLPDTATPQLLDPCGINDPLCGTNDFCVKDFACFVPSTRDLIFPAHIFTPAGTLIGPSGRERVRMNVGLMPNEDFELRYPNPNAAGFTPTVDNQRTIEVQLFRSTGRVKIARDEGEIAG